MGIVTPSPAVPKGLAILQLALPASCGAGFFSNHGAQFTASLFKLTPSVSRRSAAAEELRPAANATKLTNLQLGNA